MKPALPRPTTRYIAAKRAECKKASPCDNDEAKAKEEMREQAPFWMSQATLSYYVPSTCKEIDLKDGITQAAKEYNGVVFDASPLMYVNMMNRGDPAFGADPMPETFPGKYLAMGSFFNNSHNKPDPNATESLSPNLMGRYFLVRVEKDYSIPNPESCVSPPDIMGATLFAPAGSFILAFSGTVGSINQAAQDGAFGFPKTGYLNEYQTYEKMLEAHNKMFDGTDDGTDDKCAAEINKMMGVTEALETPEADISEKLPNGGAGFVCKGQGSEDDIKLITIVGHSLGGAQAQLAAVQIATKYKAKVRVITFESILAFTPEGAQKVVDDFIVGPDGVPDVSGKAEPTIKFPAEAGKITAQRWVEDDSPLTIAPLLYGAGALCPFPFLAPCDFFSLSYWKKKLDFVGCWPFNQNLGNGYISRALVISGFQAGFLKGPPSWGMFGCCPKGGGRLCRGCHKDTLVYPDDRFVFDISEERSYVSKGGRRASLIGNCLCESARINNHLAFFLLWMLYKGAYQNKARTNGNTVSQYVPKVYGPAPCHA